MAAAFPYPAHPRTPYPPLIVNCALTGVKPQRPAVPHVPVTPEQVADDAAAVFAAGARVVHLHARDLDGRPDWRRAAYAELVPEIRRRCPGIVVCVTTSGRADPDIAHRADVLALEGAAAPDFASLTLGSVNFSSGPSTTSIAEVEELAARMRDAGVRPELELFDLGMAHLARRLVAKGLLEPPLYANLMLGFPNGAPAEARALVALVEALPEGTVWSAGGLGDFQGPVNLLAIAMGGHVRTGLEDNTLLDGAAATNGALVGRAVSAAGACGRDVASAEATRALLGLA